jgi:hypothetical protein
MKYRKLQSVFLECLCLIAALSTVLLFSMLRYGLIVPNAWLIPPNYSSDSLYLLGLFEAVSRGECLPYSSFHVSTLGAPFIANWNDFPLTIPFILYAGGLLTRCFGLGLSANILLVFAHLVSSAAMFISMRVLCIPKIWSFTFAICFGLAPFLFLRGFDHLVITFSYSVPITLALCYLIFKNGSAFLTGWRLIVVSAIAFYFGGIFPYYVAFFLILMTFSALHCFLNEKRLRSVIPFIILALCTIAHFYLTTQPFREFSEIYGKNEFAVSRFYGNVQQFALRPVEMFLPGSDSKIPILNQISTFYENQDLFRKNFEVSESMAAYLGIPGILGFCLLAGITTYFIFTKQQQRIPGWFWIVLFFLAFAVVGGLNGILGLGKFFLLRSSNRVSIYILAACLFFLAILLTRVSNKIPKSLQFVLACMFIGISIFEALPVKATSRPSAARLWESDQMLVSYLEEKLPDGAMIFNYPVIDFPESGTYAFLRPYFFSDDLRFSFGSVKGRSREAWQHDVAKMDFEEMLKKLEAYSFSGVLVYSGSDLNKEQSAAASRMLDFFKNNRLAVYASEAGDFHFLRLQPSDEPKIPEAGPLFTKNWWSNSIQPEIPATSIFMAQESEKPNWATHRSAFVEFFFSEARMVALKGEIASVCDSRIEIFAGKDKIWEGRSSSESWTKFETQYFNATQGAVRLEIKSDCGPLILNGRKFTIGITGLKIR